MPLPLIIVPLALAIKPAAVWVGFYVLGGVFGGALGGGGIVGGAWYFFSSSKKPNNLPNQDSIDVNISPNQYSIQNSIDVMMRLGNYYQVDHKKDDSAAFDAYLKAAHLGGEEALIPLERLGEEMSAEKQLLLSGLYKTIFKNAEKANYWEEKATVLAVFDGLEF